MNWLECVVGLVLGGGISVVANRYLKYGFVYVVAGLVAMVLPIGWISGWNVLFYGHVTITVSNTYIITVAIFHTFRGFFRASCTCHFYSSTSIIILDVVFHMHTYESH